MDKAFLFREIQLWSEFPEGSRKNWILKCLETYIFFQWKSNWTKTCPDKQAASYCLGDKTKGIMQSDTAVLLDL